MATVRTPMRRRPSMFVAEEPAPTFTIIVPVYNEVSILPEFYRRVRAVMEQTGEPWELVLVDDGSRDDSSEIIAHLSNTDPRVRGIRFAGNFGFQVAVTAGLDAARGRAVILIDADLQDPPEVIPEMIGQWRSGFDVVYGVRSNRAGETWFKRVTASGFYRLIRRMTNVNIPLDTGDFRLMDRRVVNALRQMPEHNRFLRGMVSWVGYNQTGVTYERQPRYAGESKFTLGKMWRIAVDAITSFSYMPLQLASYLGFGIASLSPLAIAVVVVLRLFGAEQPLLGQATTLVAVLFLGGVQLICLGILGEVKRRPLYLIDKRWGFDPTGE